MDTSFFDTHMGRELGVCRRNFLKTGMLFLGACLIPQAVLAAGKEMICKPERLLSLYNQHTGEALQTVYWQEGEYLAEALQAINHILRDHRTDEVKTIDIALIDLLYFMHQQIESRQQWHVFSGYRSRKTNEKLRAKRQGVAKNSMHIKGKAVDIYLPGVRLSDLRAQAVAMNVGGVGYYPRSGFVHVDVGRVRYW